MPPTDYDRVPYPSLVHDQTHPDNLRTKARFFGLEPAPASDCRVLEIGCGDGLNLAGLASAYPGSTFHGIDLSAAAIARGVEMAAATGLANLTLECADLLRWPRPKRKPAPFDYIIVHGFYSWVPDAVRERLWRVLPGLLAPQGVVFLSYLTQPGAALREVTRQLMLRHSAPFTEADDRYEQGLAIVRLAGLSKAVPGLWQNLLTEQFDFLRKRLPGAVLHDELGPFSTSRYFSEFCDEAGKAGLSFLSESEYLTPRLTGGTPEGQSTLAAFAGDRLQHEQYFDYLEGRRFRQTLLCHAAARPADAPKAGLVSKLRVAARLRPEGTRSPQGERLFTNDRGTVLPITSAVLQAALEHLHIAWPAPMPWVKLEKLTAASLPAIAPSELRKELRRSLLELYAPGLIEFWSESPPLAEATDDRARIPLLSRWLASRGPATVNLRLEPVQLSPEEQSWVAAEDWTAALPDAPEAQVLARVKLAWLGLLATSGR